MKWEIKMFRRLFLLFIILSTFTITQSPAQESKKKLYRIYVNDPVEIRLIAKQRYDIYDVNPGNYIEVLADPYKIETLKTKNLKIDFIANSFRELLVRELGNALSEYHNYETTYQELTSISQDMQYPPISKLDTIGYSVDNRVIGVLKVSDYPEKDEDEPSILIVGCHHGNEILSVEAPLAFIHYLVDNYGSDPVVTNWVDTMEIYFIPLLNPDGRERLTRYNSNNVDLNRNYSFQFTSGSSHGPHAFSEPETQTIRDFVAIHPPILSLTYHTSGQLVLYSWTHTDEIAPDEPTLMQIGGIVADSLDYTLRQGGHWYFTAGEYCDYMYGVHGTMAFTVEMYTRQTPPADVIDQVMARNLPGFISLLNQVNRSGLTGLITSTMTDSPIVATIDILEIDDQELLFPRQTEPMYGRYYRYLTPGNYTVKISAPGFQPDIFYNTPVSLDSLTNLNTKLQPLTYIVEKDFQIDHEFKLFDNFPNPFNPTTKIAYSIPSRQHVILKIFDGLGREVITLVNEQQDKGYHQIIWDGTDRTGNIVSSGIYLYQLKAGNFNDIRKLLFLK